MKPSRQCIAWLTGSWVPCAVQMGILSYWSEHFQSLFSGDRVVQDPAVLHIPQQPFKAELDELPSVKQITKAIEHLRSYKSAGFHQKRRKTSITPQTPCLWSPSDLHNAVIVTLYKNKGEKSDCSNYQRITPLSIIGKNPCSSAPKQIGTHHHWRLYKRVWNNKHLKKGTKISVSQAVILITLLYSSE